jgi:hypothetical protein
MATITGSSIVAEHRHSVERESFYFPAAMVGYFEDLAAALVVTT